MAVLVAQGVPPECVTLSLAAAGIHTSAVVFGGTEQVSSKRPCRRLQRVEIGPRTERNVARAESTPPPGRGRMSTSR